MQKFNVEDLTLGEVSLVEDLSGLPISAIADDAQPKGKALTALVFVMLKRENPAATYQDATEIPLKEAMAALTAETPEADSPKGESNVTGLHAGATS